MKNIKLNKSIESILDIRQKGNVNREAIIFIHGGMGDECAAVVNEPALTRQFHVIDYHRRGWGKSEAPNTPMTIAQQVLDCKAVMTHLGVKKAHIIGQSYGGVIALQLALDFPEIIQSLALLEPGLPAILNNSPLYLAGVRQAIQSYEVGDKAGAIEHFANEIFGANYRLIFDQNLPAGYFERYVADGDNLIQFDAPALAEWAFTKENAAQISHPVLNMTGANSKPYFTEIYKTVGEWFPQAENYVLPNASHVMLQMNPKGAAEQLAQFFAKNSIS